MKKAALILFVTVALGEIMSILGEIDELHLICKPLIMITLGVYYISSVQHRSISVILAILFSLAGDISLMFDSFNPLYFMIGLVSFLISHVFYIITYRYHQNEGQGDALQGIQKVRAAFPIVLAGTGLVVILYPVLGALKFPVILYALILVIMVLNALFRFGKTNNKSFWMVFGGAILFMVSDSLLAINKFLHPLEQSGLFIMSTYIAAQFLIIEGLIKHSNNQKK
jgi:uncharacterized membrane protein YhhN